MLTIWKFPLIIKDVQNVIAPRGAKFISLIFKDNQPTLYALVNPKAPLLGNIKIALRGTGQPIEDTLLTNYKFLGTVKTDNGLLVWHVFVQI